MKKTWVVAVVAAVLCGSVHTGYADPFTRPTLTQEYCEAAKTVLSSTQSKVAFDAFLASIGSPCNLFIPHFACKVKMANATLGKPNSKEEQQSWLVCNMLLMNTKDPNNYQAPGTPTVGPAIDPKVLRQPAIDTTRIQSILIGTGLGKSKQFCEAAKILLSSTKSKEGFDALLAEIGTSCDAFFPDFECDMMEANKGLLTSMTEQMALTKCSMLKKFKK